MEELNILSAMAFEDRITGSTDDFEEAFKLMGALTNLKDIGRPAAELWHINICKKIEVKRLENEDKFRDKYWNYFEEAKTNTILLKHNDDWFTLRVVKEPKDLPYNFKIMDGEKVDAYNRTEGREINLLGKKFWVND